MFQSEVSWWHIEGNVTSTQLVLPSGVISVNYVFGIAVQTVDGYSSGVMWQQCTYQRTSSECCHLDNSQPHLIIIHFISQLL